MSDTDSESGEYESDCYSVTSSDTDMSMIEELEGVQVISDSLSITCGFLLFQQDGRRRIIMADSQLAVRFISQLSDDDQELCKKLKTSVDFKENNYSKFPDIGALLKSVPSEMKVWPDDIERLTVRFKRSNKTWHYIAEDDPISDNITSKYYEFFSDSKDITSEGFKTTVHDLLMMLLCTILMWKPRTQKK